jgi:exonuclease III
MDSLERPTQQKKDMRFETWNVRNFYRAGSLKKVASELAKYNLDLVDVQEVRRDDGGSEPADDYMSFYGNGNTNHHLNKGKGKGVPVL